MWSLNGYRITRLASRSVVLLTAYALLHGAFSTERHVVAEDAHVIPIARLDEELISLDDIRHTIALQVYRLQIDMYTLLKRETEEIVEKRLLAREAARRGLSIEDLLQREVNDKFSAVTDAEVDRYLAEHPDAAAKGNETRPRLVHYLTETRRIARRLDFLRDLRARAQYEFLLAPPPPPRVSLEIHDAPTRGTSDARVTLVHFASFSSSLSRRSFGYLQRLQEEFPGRLQWVHRHFLNTPDEVGLFAAQLSVAAHETGRFWEFQVNGYQGFWEWLLGRTDVNSHNQRITRNFGSRDRRNYMEAQSGADSFDLETQAQQSVAHKATYVTMLMGHNDVCQDNFAHIPTDDEFELNIRTGLDQLKAGLPAGATVYVLGIVDVKKLWELGEDLTWLGILDCRLLWDTSLLGLFPCATMLSPANSEADREYTRSRIAGFNSILEALVAEYDTDDPAHHYHFSSTPFDTKFTASDVSSYDCFHPSARGQKKLSELTWGDGPFSAYTK